MVCNSTMFRRKNFFVYDVTVRVCKIYMWAEKNWQHIFLKSLGVACSEKVITLLVIRVAHALYIYHHTMCITATEGKWNSTWQNKGDE